MKLTASEIQNATSGRWLPARPDRVFESISTDTRQLRPGDLFVALRGESFDAHDFLPRAVEAGAAALVIAASTPVEKRPAAIPLLEVSDTLNALGDLAAAWRGKCPARRIAVVGSSGKTTTKNMLAAILREAGPTHASAGNFNNLIGVPLSLFSLEPSARWSVLELGMNLPGELTRLTAIAEPDFLLLLGIGSAHVGQFGSQDALLEAKGESVRALRPNVPILFDSGNTNTWRIIERWGNDHPLSTFATGREAGVWSEGIEPAEGRQGYCFNLHFEGTAHRVLLPMFGRHNVANATAAAAAARAMGVAPEVIVRALSNFQAASMRSEIREAGGVTFVVDCYNANPESMRAALESVSDLLASHKRLFLVLGDMLELGDEARPCHLRLAEQAAALPFEELCLVGRETRVMVEALASVGRPVTHYDDPEALRTSLEARLQPGDLVLFKASRGNRLERVADPLIQTLSQEKVVKD
jgi:UDP-N-acetylmuramoyl-tripeptide--D-alanyl-D-alanine ligase